MAKTYTLDQVKRNIKDQDYKYCCLVDDRGKFVVAFNKAQVKALTKFEEIKKRLEVLPDGVYYVNCQNSFNPKVSPDSYPIIKGNATLNEERIPPVPVREERADNGKVMTYTEALKLTQENARLTAELSAVKKELAELEKDYADLEADFEEVDKETPLAEQPNATKDWIQTTLTQFTPILDRFADLYEKKLALDEKKIGAGRQLPEQKPANGRQLPQPGTKDFEVYLDQLEKLTDEHFQKECEYLSKFHPDIYVHVYEAFHEPEAEPSQEEKEN